LAATCAAIVGKWPRNWENLPGSVPASNYIMVVFWHRTLQNYPGHWTKTREPKAQSLKTYQGSLSGTWRTLLAMPIGTSLRLLGDGTFFARPGNRLRIAGKPATYLEPANSAKGGSQCYGSSEIDTRLAASSPRSSNICQTETMSLCWPFRGAACQSRLNSPAA